MRGGRPSYLREHGQPRIGSCARARSGAIATPKRCAAPSAMHAKISLGEAVAYMQSAIGVSMIAFGGFSWALDGAAAPVAAVLRLEPAMRPAGALRSGSRPLDAKRPHEIRLRDVTFAYPT